MLDRSTHKRFFRDNIFVHTHVEKAAGTTLNEGLEKIFGKQAIHDERLTKTRLEKTHPREQKHKKLIVGHFQLNRNPQISRHRVGASHDIKKNNLYICTLRDPVSRFISHYNYVMAGDRADRPENKGKSLEEFTKDWIDAKRAKVVNAQCIVLTGDKNADAQSAIRSLERNYLLAIPFHQVNHALQEFADAFNDKITFDSKHKANVSPKKDTSLSDLTRKLLEASSKEDQLLYEYVEKHYESFVHKFQHYIEMYERTAQPVLVGIK